MSVLANANGQGKIAEALFAAARPIVAKAIWEWYHANADRVLFSKKVLFFPTFTIRLSDFRGIIEEIAGPEPASA